MLAGLHTSQTVRRLYAVVVTAASCYKKELGVSWLKGDHDVQFAKHDHVLPTWRVGAGMLLFSGSFCSLRNLIFPDIL